MKRRSSSGFTLVELVIIIVVLGIVAAVAIPRIGSILESSRVNATKDEMGHIKQAIIGDTRVTGGGKYVNVGYEGNIGYPPSNLVDLVRKPDSIPVYDRFTSFGWNGPYLDSAEQHYLYDAWDSLYQYDANNRTITSIGANPDLTVTF